MAGNTTTEQSGITTGARPVRAEIQGMPTSDGAGVRLTRYIGSPELDSLDPFLLLDLFESDDPNDYIAGFPPHPHRGFETVTYLLAGRMRHEDNAGHAGVIEAGDIQWMTAGRGIVHSEMPEQEEGRLAGFQLWVNLPAASKMTAPAYQEYAAASIPVESRRDGVRVKVITGRTSAGTTGPVRDVATAPLYLDVTLPADCSFEEPLPATHNAVLFVVEGELTLPGGRPGELHTVGPRRLVVLGEGDRVRAAAQGKPARFLLIAGRRLDEPVARYGPFVMNSREELIRAFEDYQAGRF